MNWKFVRYGETQTRSFNNRASNKYLIGCSSDFYRALVSKLVAQIHYLKQWDQRENVIIKLIEESDGRAVFSFEKHRHKVFGVGGNVVGFKLSGKRTRVDQALNLVSVYVDKPFSQNVNVRSIEKVADLQCTVDDCTVVGRKFSVPQMEMGLKLLLVRSKSPPPTNSLWPFSKDALYWRRNSLSWSFCWTTLRSICSRAQQTFPKPCTCSLWFSSEYHQKWRKAEKESQLLAQLCP